MSTVHQKAWRAATILMVGSLALVAAEPDAAAWKVRGSVDYSHYDLSLGVPETSGDATLKGSVVGGSLGLKLPCMRENDWVDLSYRHGDLDGTMANTGFNLRGDASTDIDQAGIMYRYQLLPTPASDLKKLELEVLLGVNWLRNDLTWTAPVPGVATYVSHFKEDLITGNLGVSGGWQLLTRTSQDGQHRFQLGPRAEAIGGAGVQMFDRNDNFSSTSETERTFSFDGKGLVRAEYTVGRTSCFLEGGYQYLRFFHTTHDEIYKGPLVRLGVGYAF